MHELRCHFPTSNSRKPIVSFTRHRCNFHLKSRQLIKINTGFDGIRSIVRQLDSPTVSLATYMWCAWDFFLSNSRTKHWNTHFAMWFKQRKHIFNFLLFSILCKSVGLSSCRTIELSDYRYAPLWKLVQIKHLIWTSYITCTYTFSPSFIPTIDGKCDNLYFLLSTVAKIVFTNKKNNSQFFNNDNFFLLSTLHFVM